MIKYLKNAWQTVRDNSRWILSLVLLVLATLVAALSPVLFSFSLLWLPFTVVVSVMLAFFAFMMLLYHNPNSGGP